MNSKDDHDLMQVIFHVDEAYVDAVLDHLLQRQLYGLQPDNILVLPIPGFYGCQADSETTLGLVADLESTPRSAGSGVAMLSCGWTDYAYKCVLCGAQMHDVNVRLI
jgi:hypothetical protein